MHIHINMLTITKGNIGRTNGKSVELNTSKGRRKRRRKERGKERRKEKAFFKVIYAIRWEAINPQLVLANVFL